MIFTMSMSRSFTVEMLRTNAHGLHFVSPQLLAVTGTCLHTHNVSVCRNANFSDDIGSSEFQQVDVLRAYSIVLLKHSVFPFTIKVLNTYINTLWSVNSSTIIFSNVI